MENERVRLLATSQQLIGELAELGTKVYNFTFYLSRFKQIGLVATGELVSEHMQLTLEMLTSIKNCLERLQE